jgi:hypothetical protein
MSAITRCDCDLLTQIEISKAFNTGGSRAMKCALNRNKYVKRSKDYPYSTNHGSDRIPGICPNQDENLTDETREARQCQPRKSSDKEAPSQNWSDAL